MLLCSRHDRHTLWPPLLPRAQMLTLRRERDWPALAQRINTTHKVPVHTLEQLAAAAGWRVCAPGCRVLGAACCRQDGAGSSPMHGCTRSWRCPQDYATHVHDVEVDVLPRLAHMRPVGASCLVRGHLAHLLQQRCVACVFPTLPHRPYGCRPLCAAVQDELASAGLLFTQQKQTASLAPQTGSAFDAAAAAGPHVASVLGGPLLAGNYQPHSHHPGAQTLAAAATGGAQGAPVLGQPGSSGSSGLPIATPDKIVSPSQQVLMGEEP